MKKLIRDAAIYFGLALGCLVGADYVPFHDQMILISGVLLGGMCAMIVLIDIRLKARRVAREVQKEAHP